MLPFIDVFGMKIPLYGLLITLGVALGVLVAVYLPSKKNLTRQDICFAACYAGVGVLIGAKLLFLATALPQLLQMSPAPPLTWELILKLLRYGFVFYGGALGGILGVFIYARQFKLKFLPLVENIVPSVPLIHAIGRLGCFCAGCCYGIPMNPPFGVFFREDSVAPHDIALFPIQLLESLLNLLLFAGIFVFSRKERRNGQILGFYFVGYGIERFILEYFRYDSARGIWAGLSTSQWISLVLIPIGFYLFMRRDKAAGRARQDEQS